MALDTARSYANHRAGLLAAGVAYYGVLSLFPLLLVFTTLASFALAGRDELQEELTTSALADFPILGDEIRRNVGEIEGSGLALAFGLVVALWAGLGAMQALQAALQTIWQVETDRSAIASRMRSLGILAVIALGTVGSTAAATGVAWLGGGALGRMVAVVTGIVVTFGVYVVAYRLLAGVPRLPWRAHVPGSGLAAISTGVLQTIGVVLLERQLRNASALYGLFGLFIGLLWWVYLQALVTLLGAELNVVVHRRGGLTTESSGGATRAGATRAGPAEARGAPSGVSATDTTG